MAGATEKLAAARASKAKTATPAVAPTTTAKPARASKAAATAQAAPAPTAKPARRAAAAATPTPAKTAKAKAESTSPVGRVNPQKDAIRADYTAGMSRSELQEKYKLSYPAIYFHTKDLPAQEGTGGRARVFLENGQSRAESMRKDFTDGMTIGDIGRKYGTVYQVAYQAVKTLIDRSPVEA